MVMCRSQRRKFIERMNETNRREQARETERREKEGGKGYQSRLSYCELEVLNGVKKTIRMTINGHHRHM